MPQPSPATLGSLRRVVAGLEHGGIEPGGRTLALGVKPLDCALGGGLACNALHEIAPQAPRDFAAAAGFALALAARGQDSKHGGTKDTLWIQTGYAGMEGGHLYAPGCEAFGLPVRRLLILELARPLDVLWAVEEALKCCALATVIVEMTGDSTPIEFLAMRRLALAAREGSARGLLLRHRATDAPSVAATRWRVAAAASKPDAWRGLGHPAFDLSLIKNRRGPNGQWTIEWNRHDRIFQALSVAVAAMPADRPDRADFARTG